MRFPYQSKSNTYDDLNNFNNSQEQRISIPNLLNQTSENTPENTIKHPSTGQSNSFNLPTNSSNQNLSLISPSNGNSYTSQQRFDNHGLQEHNFYNSCHPGLSPSIYNQSSQLPQYSHVLSGQTQRANISYNPAGETPCTGTGSVIDTSRQGGMSRNW